MPRVELQDGTVLVAVDMSAEAALKLHGYDPDAEDYSVQLSKEERLLRLEDELGLD